MKKKKKNNGNEIDFWQSSSDLMTALLLILMLIILLLILYLIKMPDREYIEYFDEPNTEHELEEGSESESETETETERRVEKQQNQNGNENGNGGSEESEPETEEGEFPYEEEGIKSAVYVMLIDGDTEKTVKEEGVMFELRDAAKKLQILSTYYPERITYRDFETTEDGTFFLPEKIYQGRYYFKNLTEATGYDLAEDAWFDLDDLYDWPDPYVVKIPVFPSRNIIKIKMVDKETGKPVTGAVFDVEAAEDVVTLDGTLRYSKGEIVSQITCDENGYGESKEIYLGTYLIKETQIPQYYASIVSPIEYTVEQRSETETDPEVIENEKTRIVLTLTDELDESPIPGAEYVVTGGVSEKKYTTDDSGQIVLDDLDKDTLYTFVQDSSSGDYLADSTPISAKVSQRGRFALNAEKELSAKNHMIRVRMNVKDALLNTPISDASISLYSEDKKIVKTWTATGVQQIFTDLKEGTYYAVVNGNEKKQFQVVIEDTINLQDKYISIYTTKSYLVIAGIIVVAAGLIAGIIAIIRHLGRRKSGES